MTTQMSTAHDGGLPGGQWLAVAQGCPSCCQELQNPQLLLHEVRSAAWLSVRRFP